MARDADPSELSPDLLRVARQIHTSGHRVVALMPGSRGLETATLAHRLAVSLARLTGEPVGWLDVSARFRKHAEDIVGSNKIDDDGLFRTATVSGVLWVAPHHPGTEGTRFQLVSVLLNHVEASQDPKLSTIFVDLTGFFRVGELLGVLPLIDGLIMVARAGKTKKRELVRIHREIPPEKNLGVLVTQ